jgi:predicted metal-dependent peptidase
MGAVNAGYHKPSRRQAGLGFGLGSAVLPAYFSPVPRVMMMLDTSGSMGTDEVSRGCSEGAQVIKALGCPITFGSIDTEVHALGKVRHYSEFASLVKGGGGTDFRDAFKLIESMPKHEKPEILIFATDGCGPAPSQPPPNLHVVWLLIGRYKQKPYASDDGGYANMGEITYGEFIEVDETE